MDASMRIMTWYSGGIMQYQRSNYSVRWIWQLGALAVIVGMALNYQLVLDQYALATFRPQSDVAAIEGRLQLTSSARAMLYRAQPQIDDKASFNHDCDTQPHELELGCYYRGHIYVLHIDNDSLAPEMDVVTAHELLHAAWTRMSADERKVVGDELKQAYAQINDSELKDRMAEYAKSEPGEEENELHSILATEQLSLPSALEQHYAKYFANRGQIVAAHAKYQDVFDARRTELEQELGQIRSEKAQLAVINRQLDTYRGEGDVQSYNELVPRQNRLVDDINQRISLYRQGVDEYNALSKSLESQTITDTEVSAQ